MNSGTIFDIEEGSIYGSSHLGITIYLKGCKLKCDFCHSPEGQNAHIENIVLQDGTVKNIGEQWSVKKLSEYMNTMNKKMDVDFVFSGGEPLLQGYFLLQVFKQLKGKFNIILDTSGYCQNLDLFQQVLNNVQFVDYGLKFIDFKESLMHTAKSSYIQLHNLIFLDRKMATPYQIVIPLIPGIFDTEKYKNELDKLSKKLVRCKKIIFNKFNNLTYAKYKSYGYSTKR